MSRPARRPRHRRSGRRAARRVSLPLHFSTGSATRVITVTASSYGSTTATLQPWVKQSGGGWKKQGSAIHAHIGADGMSTHPSESRSATPIGSFTLTQAFGYYSNPGTPLPYFKTTMSDYWISSPGRLYNTHQRCGSCGYNNGVNERLATETPFYNYAVVIDYNTRNAPGGVHAGRGQRVLPARHRRLGHGRLRRHPAEPAGADHEVAESAHAPAHPHRRQLSAGRGRPSRRVTPWRACPRAAAWSSVRP